MTFYLLWLAIVIVLDLTVAIKSGLCGCGKHKKWILPRGHFKLPSLIFDIFSTGVLAYVAFLCFGWSGLIGVSFWVFVDIYRVYLHEKDKIKKAMRSLGQVVIKDNGRLGVDYG